VVKENFAAYRITLEFVDHHIIVDNHSVVLRDLSQVVEDGDPEGVEDHP
jgi:hypothetical protein